MSQESSDSSKSVTSETSDSSDKKRNNAQQTQLGMSPKVNKTDLGKVGGTSIGPVTQLPPALNLLPKEASSVSEKFYPLKKALNDISHDQQRMIFAMRSDLAMIRQMESNKRQSASGKPQARQALGQHALIMELKNDVQRSNVDLAKLGTDIDNMKQVFQGIDARFKEIVIQIVKEYIRRATLRAMNQNEDSSKKSSVTEATPEQK